MLRFCELTVIEAEVSKYFTVPSPGGVRHTVLALNAWTANCLTWDSGNTTKHRPPQYAGATLGGLDRMRGFATVQSPDEFEEWLSPQESWF